jgi:UDP-glucose:glycoprotein glucosyltransferase
LVIVEFLLVQVLLNGIPLPQDSLDADNFEEAVLTEIMAQTPTLQRAVYKGEVTDKDNILDYLMSKPNVMPRYIGYLLTCSLS